MVVQKLGFANLAVGLWAIANHAGVGTIILASGLFYGLAGLKHLTRQARNRFENTALTSDLFVFVVLRFYFIKAEVWR